MHWRFHRYRSLEEKVSMLLPTVQEMMFTPCQDISDVVLQDWDAALDEAKAARLDVGWLRDFLAGAQKKLSLAGTFSGREAVEKEKADSERLTQELKLATENLEKLERAYADGAEPTFKNFFYE
ncbi:uncharacterized protein LOC113317440 [Papaver somniferum]|uniref:uncharacterized protein LOC113317440 n=1 Tax=Papaver somniferum TaxID=3469 RepID=UPI000E6F6C72|nr:uncharacterized protein LOC113317440 [Papaver somniferum]